MMILVYYKLKFILENENNSFKNSFALNYGGEEMEVFNLCQVENHL